MGVIVLLDDDEKLFYEELYFFNGDAVPFDLDDCEINIYPIKVKDAPRYERAKAIFSLNKNEINDIKILQMNYLEFLIKKVLVADVMQYELAFIMEHCLHEKNVALYDNNGNPFLKNNKPVIVLFDEEKKVKGFINNKQFLKLKDIILHQNDADYDQRELSPEVRKNVEQYYKIKYKDVNYPNIEKQKALVISKTGMSLQQINDMTFRMFKEVFSSIVDSETYVGDKIIQGSYKYEVKEDIIYPLYRKKVDPIEQAFASKDAFEGQISKVQ